jgi:hypothetical protein
MSPIITHEDELELASIEKDLASKIKKLAKSQNTLTNSQKKYAENLAKTNLVRQSLNRTYRDVLKQMQVLARESKSNIKDEEVNLFQEIIHKNDDYIEANDKYFNVLKDITVKKEYFITKKIQLADAITDVASRRAVVIKKALDVEKAKNKLIEGDKLNLLDQQLNDVQRAFDRSRDVFLKQVDQFIEVRNELDSLWLKLQGVIKEFG